MKIQEYKKIKLETSCSDESDSSSLSPGSLGSECRSPSPFSSAPKKRFKIDALKQEQVKKPFRPWTVENNVETKTSPWPLFWLPALSELPEQREPLALVKTKKEPSENLEEKQKSKQRNYKNMTRERRVEANARERQRVQTITEQYDTLRSVIPIEDSSAKMSKLSIIKIATSYIQYLSRQCGYDYSADKSEPSIEECYVNLKNLIKYESRVQARD